MEQNLIDIVKNIPIEDVVEKLNLKLNKHGKSLMGECPTGHGSKGKKCFSVETGGNYFYCFHQGCGKGGDNIELVKITNNVDFKEALSWIVQEFYPELTPELKKSNGKYKQCEKDEVIYQRALFYEEVFNLGKELLYTEEGKEALNYLVKIRGYEIENLKQTEWIYFPYDSQIRLHLGHKFPDNKSFISDRKALPLSGFYGDNFRLAFPYRDYRGVITGFVKRSTLQEGAEITTYDKKIHTGIRYDSITGTYKYDLFRLHKCKGMKTVLIVEGYPDALYLPTLGIDNITAIGQGNLSATHISGLKQAGIKNVIISFDNDPPKECGVLTGKENTKKATLLLEKAGFTVFTVEPELMSPHKDPDEYIKANGVASYKQLLTDSVLYKDSKEEKEMETITTTTTKMKKATKAETYQKVKDLLKEWYDFKFNTITQKTEYSPYGEKSWKEIEDGFSAMCYFKLIENNLYWSKNDLDNLLVNPDFATPYDPFLDYFENLPEWDGKTDYIKQYTDNIILVDESKREKLRLDFKKWITATLTGIYKTDWCNHHIFTLIGGQGKGKSHYLNKLIPPELKTYLQIGIDFENKDSRQQMASRFLINIDELEGYSKKDQNNLKTSITTKHFDIRVPYGRYTAKYTKRCSFMGSTNQMNFLPDPTGSRRFLIQYVKEIYYQNPVDIDNIFSQAKHLYFNGFQFYFCGKEVETIISENEEFSSDSMEEQLLLTYYSPGNDLYYTTTDMALQIGKKVAGVKIDGGFIKKLGSFLGKHKFKRGKKNQRYVWYCNEKPFDYPEVG